LCTFTFILVHRIVSFIHLSGMLCLVKLLYITSLLTVLKACEKSINILEQRCSSTYVNLGNKWRWLLNCIHQLLYCWERIAVLIEWEL